MLYELSVDWVVSHPLKWTALLGSLKPSLSMAHVGSYSPQPVQGPDVHIHVDSCSTQPVQSSGRGTVPLREPVFL